MLNYIQENLIMTPQFVQHDCEDIASLVINRMLMSCISIQN